MTEKHWMFIAAIGLTLFHLVVIPWGLDQFINGSNEARMWLMLSSVITVPVLFATLLMNIICGLCLVVPVEAQTRVLNYGRSKKVKKAWRLIEKTIDIFD